MSKIAVTIGRRLRECRDAKGLSLEELAYRSGMNPAHIGQLERGVKCPTMTSLHNLLNGLNLSFSQFFDFEMLPVGPQHTKEIEKIDAILVTLSPKELEAVHTALKCIVKGFRAESEHQGTK